MAQTGYTPISLYYSTTASTAPTAGNLVAGELAINTADGKLYYKDSSGVVQTLATKDTTAGTFTSITDSGNLTFTGTGNRIRGDFNNTTIANRAAFQTSTTNASTNLTVFPNGTGTGGSIVIYPNSADPANSSVGQFRASSASGDVGIVSTVTGTGTVLPITFSVSSEAMRIDTGRNLLLGTTTSPTTTGAAGSMSIAGYGIYGIATANGVTNTTGNYGLVYQNANLNITGATQTILSGLQINPLVSHDATGGTAAIVIRGITSQPLITSSAATSVLNFASITANGLRTYSTDTSSSGSNTAIGMVANYGHAATLSTSALTGTAYGVQASLSMLAGSATTATGFIASGSISPTTGSVTITNRYGFFDGALGVGNSTGTATVTNYYGLYLNGPSVGANGTVTNRWGIYQGDTTGTNYLAAPTKITNGYTVATLPTGAAAAVGMRAYVTDALAPTFLGVVVGGGAVVTPVFHNGVAWVAG